MDDIVKAALAKWPNVPDCLGWLALDARGDWYMRDDRTQAAGPFPASRGSRIVHDKLREFIGRNYEADGRGHWFFQNGPQRVYVELEAAPWVWRLEDAAGKGQPAAFAHTGQAVRLDPSRTWLDEHERLFIGGDPGLGLVHTLDMGIAADAVERGAWAEPMASTLAGLAKEFGHCLSPQRESAATKKPT